VSTKLFTLIEPKDIHLNAGQKILPQEEFSSLLSARELIQTCLQEATAHKQAVVAEIEVAQEIAQRQGYEEGLERWSKEVFKLEEEVEKIRQEIEKAILKIALKAAQTIVGREMKQSPETMVDIVTTTLRAVSQHKKISIYCSRSDFELLDASRPKLKALFEQLDALSVHIKPELPPGGYIIETERGIINNSDIEKVWINLEKAFLSKLNKSEA
jgi:type III secretion protein L